MSMYAFGFWMSSEIFGRGVMLMNNMKVRPYTMYTTSRSLLAKAGKLLTGRRTEKLTHWKSETFSVAWVRLEIVYGPAEQRWAVVLFLAWGEVIIYIVSRIGIVQEFFFLSLYIQSLWLIVVIRYSTLEQFTYKSHENIVACVIGKGHGYWVKYGT